MLNKEAMAEAPDNPRLIWVRGPILWNTPPEKGGGEDAAIASYQKALQSFKIQKLGKLIHLSRAGESRS
jgi:hypothetical protein